MNELSDLRKQKRLTQKEAAVLIGIPYRTYLRYEENDRYANTFKYRKIIEELENKTRIDEEHGVLSIQTIKEIVLPILKKYNINKCYLFGSYAKNIARDNSDIDLLVETDMTGLAYLNLIEELRDALHKKVDLLNLNDVSENNPISLRILKEGVLLKDD